MKRLFIGILAFVFATTFVMPVQAQETGEDAAEAAGAAVQDAAEATGEAVQDAAEATGEAVQDAGEAVQEAGEGAAAAAGDALEEVSEAAEDAYEGAADNEWLWILGLAGAFIIVWFLLRRRKARRTG